MPCGPVPVSITILVVLPVILLMTPGVNSLGNELFACDFENDLCGLIQDTNDHFDWTRHHGSTDTCYTGPREAYSGTYYIYLNANQHADRGAYLRTPNIDYQGQACVTLAYHMHGSKSSYLVVATTPHDETLWYTYGNQGDRWIERAEQVNLDYGDGIRLRGSVGEGIYGDIAVDDLVITEGRCKEEVSLPYHCSFESGLCGMTQRYDDQFDWTRYNRSTGSRHTGPRSASDGEWFIYINASTSGLDNGNTALIETPTFNHTGTLCLRFNYHMYGYSVGTLTALRTTSRESRYVFQEIWDKGNAWHSAAVDVSGFQPGAWITFSASRGDDYYGDIAVDNINIATGRCIRGSSCQQLCIQEPNGDRCACHHGYRLDSDTRCADIDECSEKTSGCSQLCHNTDGGFICSCGDGFRLDTDNSTCQDIDECTTDHACQQQCVNTAGGYTCACGDHYVLATDDRHCIGCTEAYQLMVRASQGFRSLCETVALLPDVSLETCLREAYDKNVSVVAHLNSLCDLKRCQREELNLAVLEGQKGWDVYALNSTWVERVAIQQDVDDGSSASSLGKILVGVFGGSAVIVAVVVSLVLVIRRRRMTSQNDDPAVTYDVTVAEEPTNPPDGSVYEEINTTDYLTMLGTNPDQHVEYQNNVDLGQKPSVMPDPYVGTSTDVTVAEESNNPPDGNVCDEINTTDYLTMLDTSPDPDVEYQNNVVCTVDFYQDLGSNRQPVPDPYDTLNV